MSCARETPVGVLLVPPINVDDGRLPPNVAYGLWSLRAAAAAAGHDVDVLDFTSLWFEDRRYSTSEEVVEVVAGLIDTDRYAVVGCSTMCGSFHHTLGVAAALAARSPRTRIWLGGPQASTAPADLLAANPEVEAVFIGEGEATFVAALDRLAASPDTDLAGIPGVWTRTARYAPRALIARLDDLPRVDRDPAFLAAFTDSLSLGVDEALPLEAERGCPGRCAFCSTTSHWGGRVRRKSGARIVDEMRGLRDATGVRAFSLIGDNLASPRRGLLELCATMRSAALGTTWNCSIKLDRLEEGDLETMWLAGCRGFFVGVESASQATLDRIGKGVDLEREVGLIHAAVDRGFKVVTSFIVGFPWETHDDMLQTCDLHLDLMKGGVFHSILSSLSPLPGTEFAGTLGERLGKQQGVSATSRDGLAVGPDALALMRRCPSLFTQLDHVECEATWAQVFAVVTTGHLLSAHHGMGVHAPDARPAIAAHR